MRVSELEDNYILGESKDGQELSGHEVKTEEKGRVHNYLRGERDREGRVL